MSKLEDAGYTIHPKNWKMGRIPNRPKWYETTTRQNGSDNKNNYTKERKRVETFFGGDPFYIEVYQKFFSAYIPPQKTT